MMICFKVVVGLILKTTARVPWLWNEIRDGREPHRRDLRFTVNLHVKIDHYTVLPCPSPWAVSSGFVNAIHVTPPTLTSIIKT
jgi:hypothetical protein